MPYAEGQCLCGGCKVFVDAEPQFKVRLHTLSASLLIDGERRAWEYATARIVIVATVAPMLVRCSRRAKPSEQRDQSSYIRL